MVAKVSEEKPTNTKSVKKEVAKAKRQKQVPAVQLKQSKSSYILFCEFEKSRLHDPEEPINANVAILLYLF